MRSLGAVVGDGIVCFAQRTCVYVSGGDGSDGMVWMMVSFRTRWGYCVSCRWGLTLRWRTSSCGDSTNFS